MMIGIGIPNQTRAVHAAAAEATGTVGSIGNVLPRTDLAGIDGAVVAACAELVLRRRPH